jgi:CheY-like chemotaxis protein
VSGRAIRVLLVEDDPNDIVLTRRAFRKAELPEPIAIVKDGEQAVAYLGATGEFTDRRAHPLPDLVLLDLKLPRMTGLEVLTWLRQQPSLQRLPVIVLTSSREISDVNRAYELGANSYLSKPVTFDSLTRIVSDLDRYWGELNVGPEVERPQ